MSIISQNTTTELSEKISFEISETLKSLNPYMVKERKPFKKKHKAPYLYLFTDSEWGKKFSRLGRNVIVSITLAVCWDQCSSKWDWKLYINANPMHNTSHSGKGDYSENNPRTVSGKIKKIVDIHLGDLLAEGKVVFLEARNKTGYINRILEDFSDAEFLRICFKYSHSDLRILFGSSFYDNLCAYGDSLVERRGIKFSGDEIIGTFSDSPYYYEWEDSEKVKRKLATQLWDLQGLSKSSLGVQAQEVGVDAGVKNSLDDFKSDMGFAFMTKTYDAVKYSINDVILLPKICLGYLENYNKNTSDLLYADHWYTCLGLDSDYFYNWDTLPKTTGSYVMSIWEMLIYNYPVIYECYKKLKANPDDKDFLVDHKTVIPYRVALFKYTVPDDKIDDEMMVTYQQINRYLSKVKSFDHVQGFLKTIVSSAKWGKQEDLPIDEFFYNPKNPASAPSISQFVKQSLAFPASPRFLASLEDSLAYAHKTQGGRIANNNQWINDLKSCWCDPDQSAAYGTKMREVILPIGLPTTVSSLPSEQTLVKNTLDISTLPFISKLIESGDVKSTTPFMTYSSTVEQFSFNQDLVFSTRYPQGRNSIKKAAGISETYDEEGDLEYVEFDDNKKSVSEFNIFTKEFENSPIGYSHYQAFNEISSNSHKKEFYDQIKLVCSIGWYESNRIDDPMEWALKILQDDGTLEMKGDRAVTDTRSRIWHPIPMAIIIDRCLTDRSKYKKLMKQAKSDGDEALEGKYNALQNCLKLVTNTSYGDMGCIYFKTSNAVVASQITEGVRMNQWIMSKALGTYQDITDGGYCNLLKIPYISDTAYKPSFDSFTHLHYPSNSKKDFKEVKQEGLTPWIDYTQTVSKRTEFIQLGAYEGEDCPEIQSLLNVGLLTTPKVDWEYTYKVLEECSKTHAENLSILHHKQKTLDKMRKSTPTHPFVIHEDKYKNMWDVFEKAVNGLMNKHIARFSTLYNFDKPVSIEIKVGHTAKHLSIGGKADYTAKLLTYEVKSKNDFSSEYEVKNSYLNVKRGVKLDKNRKEYTTKSGEVIVKCEEYGYDIHGNPIKLAPNKIFDHTIIEMETGILPLPEAYTVPVVQKIKDYRIALKSLNKDNVKAEESKTLAVTRDCLPPDNGLMWFFRDATEVWEGFKYENGKAVLVDTFHTTPIDDSHIYITPPGEFYYASQNPPRIKNTHLKFETSEDYDQAVKRCSRTSTTNGKKNHILLFEQYPDPQVRIKKMLEKPKTRKAKP